MRRTVREQRVGSSLRYINRRVRRQEEEIASPQGGQVQISVKPEEEHLVIGISDQGIGISPADQAKLFGPFQRLGESRLEGVRGLGLGLLVCRRLVEAHDGQIWVESEPSRGSTFFFTLPLVHTST